VSQFGDLSIGDFLSDHIVIDIVAISGEPCAYIDLDAERREKEKDAGYI
jgi:hypothetical protein